MSATPLACVIGWPVKHSRSPIIHRFWLKQHGIAGDYVVQPVEPEKASAFFAGFAESGYVGGNVTVPHKEAAFAAVADMEPAAREIGAVNTLWLEDKRLRGTNTDGFGFLANLDQEAPGWDRNPGPAVVLGAGGAARAVLWALATRGFAPITLVNRTRERAETLARQFGPTVTPADWDALPKLLPATRLLVNTTTLGMEGQPPLAIGLAPVRDDALVTDLVYVPLETPLLAAVRARGLRAVDGLGMLLHQAVPGFERWFGRRPEVTPALRAAVLESMKAR
jgi:shikimate dehydrogenase